MESTCKTKMELRENLPREDAFYFPIETGLPPFHATLNLFEAVIENKVAEMELGVKKIFDPKEHLGMVSNWAELNNNQKSLTKLFSDSNKVIKENKACCSRFREKIQENTLDRANLGAQIAIVQCEVKDYKNVKNEMEAYVEEYSIYEKFLRDIAQNYSEFNSVGDILNRYETLEHTRKECARLLEEGLEEATELRKRMSTLLEEKSNRLKEINNQLIMIQVRHKEAKEERRYWEQTLYKIKKIISRNEEDRVNIGGASWDLYRQMCQRSKVAPTAGERDINAHMDFIKTMFLFYKEVIVAATSAKQARSTALNHELKRINTFG